MPADPVEFGETVFLNVPYDEEYRPLLQSLIFTLLDCGLTPCLASGHADSGSLRLEKIRDLIRSSRFSIHDISRMEPLQPGDLPRFNMPFELGLDLGCRFFGNPPLTTKQCLILESERDRYRRALSDISGNDIRAHNNAPNSLAGEVRNWILLTTGRKLPSGSRIWLRYSQFTSFLQLSLAEAGFTQAEIKSLEVAELIQLAGEWIRKNPLPAEAATAQD
jgi:hypothetical protein